MVVCKCRKATRLYCFVHKVPVCGECICYPEHLICVVKKYSDWVVDGEYDWPPTCSLCHVALEGENDDSQNTRLGCLHLVHTSCLVSHIRSFPPETAPAGYLCPACSTPLWPPSSIKDTGSRLHSKLKEAIFMSGLEKNVLGNHLVVSAAAERQPPPAFASDPLVQISPADVRDNKINALDFSTQESNFNNTTSPDIYKANPSHSNYRLEPDIVEIDAPTAAGSPFISTQESNFNNITSPSGQPSAGTRKITHSSDRQTIESTYYADDEDGNHRKYNRRGPFHHKLLRMLLPFWSPALPTLPVTAPTRKEGGSKEVPDGRSRHQRSSRTDPRKILLTIAILACMVTMGILYYRLATRSLGVEDSKEEAK